MQISNKKILTNMVMLVVGMFLLAYAAVPIYNLFCKVTGYGGTTQQAITGSKYKGSRSIKVTFDANVMPDLPWVFKPEQKEVTVKTGENTLAFYAAENISNEDIIGTAVYNVTPAKAGIYFNKIQCFCFEEQLLKAGEKMEMPLSFFIDPELENDDNMKDVDDIVLSYTFYRVKK